MKACEVCGKATGKIYGKQGKFKIDLCEKHHNQMTKHGSIYKTRFDTNTSHCDICGSTVDVCGETGKHGIALCVKHRHQMDRHGKILDRTVYDGNTFTKCEDHYVMNILVNNKEQLVKIDIDDVQRVSEHRWTFRNHTHSRVVALIDSEYVALGNFIVGSKQRITYANKDKNDCRKVNILAGSKSQQCANNRIPKNNTSGYKGVYWSQRGGKWKAQIKVNQKCIALGQFSDIQDAVAARKAAEVKYFGDFAYDESRDVTLDK